MKVMRILTPVVVTVRDLARTRLSKLRTLLAWRFMWGNYYGERLRDYPVTVALRLLLVRIIFLTQIPLLLPDKYFSVRYYGAKLKIRLFSHPVFMDMASGVYEYRKARLFRQLIKENMIVLDIGAYEGNYSIIIAKLMHDKGKVLAFEPDPVSCKILEDNIRVNNFKSVEVHQLALSDRKGTSTFYPGTSLGPGKGLGSLVSRSPWYAQFQREPMAVKVSKLDDLLDELDIGHVDLIKIDVEGAELLVLKGAEHTLRSNCVHLLMDVDVESNTERMELYRILDSFGYEIYRIGRLLTRIRSADELLLFPTNPVSRTDSSRSSPNGIISSLENPARTIIPPKLLPKLGSIYYRIRPQNKKHIYVREIYAVKINHARANTDVHRYADTDTYTDACELDSYNSEAPN